jgi:hypothetical protein
MSSKNGMKTEQGMRQVSDRSVTRSADLLLNDDSEPARRQVSQQGAGYRPSDLQEVLNVVGDVLLSPQAPDMAGYVAGNVYRRLEKRGSVREASATDLKPPEHLQRALANVAASLPRFAAIKDSLFNVAERLTWRRGRGGPFASLNFETAHAHAVIVGPGGMEERSDVRLGLTLMAPYSRFPDHVQFHSRVFMLLSDGEVCLDDSNWFRAIAGTIFFNEAGRKFAMRCTAEPLLAIWCHVEDASL